MADLPILGMAICAYNRAQQVGELITSIQELTEGKHTLVVCDDGSTDNTVEVCTALNVQVITGTNRGVAWNKNRGLYWLLHRTPATHFLLVEDDMLAIENAWDRIWVAAIDRWGHANWADQEYMASRTDRAFKGAGTLEDPFLAKMLTGCGMAFSRDALATVGYFDTRFKGYGSEHLDMTRRMWRAGFGVERAQIGEGDPANYYVSISGGLKMRLLPSPADKSGKSANQETFDRLLSEGIRREAWRNEDERVQLIREMTSAQS